MNRSDAGANYVLSVLLPRLEEMKPGLLEEIALGVSADKQAVVKSGKMNSELEQVFLSAERILGQASI
ncbi:hypothetical protein QTO30_14630 [Yoonia sp. GPGPB17]|uniref:hypothetical protein n=1 Tax=Yoonia sp. GPGPB17 TaxID=3026147 RepID=UPI0030C290B6